MMEFGKTLRTAREARGYTIAQLAEVTRLAPSAVENLENENFSFLAAPVYGRGFIKLYCEAVGLESKPLVDAFMEISTNNPPPSVPDPLTKALPAADKTPADKTLTEAEGNAEPIPVQPPPPPQDLFTSREHEAPAAGKSSAFSRYATSFRSTGHDLSSVWRIGVLSVGAALILALLLWGLFALRRATAPTAEPAPDNASAAAPAEAETVLGKSSAPARQDRARQDIPALYID